MKRYTDYTPKELAQLSEDQVERLIEIENALEGIEPVVPPQPITLEPVGIVKTHGVYKIDDVFFANEKDAIAFGMMERYGVDYDYNGAGYEYKWLERRQSSSISREIFYRQDDVAKMARAIMESKSKTEMHKKQQKKYTEFAKATGANRDAVWSAVLRAREQQEAIELARQTLERYRDLSGGDEETAIRFFRNTYKDKPAILDTVLGEVESCVEV